MPEQKDPSVPPNERNTCVIASFVQIESSTHVLFRSEIPSRPLLFSPQHGHVGVGVPFAGSQSDLRLLYCMLTAFQRSDRPKICLTNHEGSLIEARHLYLSGPLPTPMSLSLLCL